MATWDTLPCRNYQNSLEKLHRDAAECELRANLATDPNKREIFTRLAQHLTTLAAEVECSMVAKAARDEEKN
jgi:hypothetical protein